jgi:hypothetical protein
MKKEIKKQMPRKYKKCLFSVVFKYENKNIQVYFYNNEVEFF